MLFNVCDNVSFENKITEERAKITRGKTTLYAVYIYSYVCIFIFDIRKICNMNKCFI